MAALAHGGILLFGMGLVAAIVLWVTQKEKSRYVAFQTLQAAAYHLAGFAIFRGAWVAGWLPTSSP
jgi:dolichyl-phosphate-mannose--protein O-mannosyl transferase